MLLLGVSMRFNCTLDSAAVGYVACGTFTAHNSCHPHKCWEVKVGFMHCWHMVATWGVFPRLGQLFLTRIIRTVLHARVSEEFELEFTRCEAVLYVLRLQTQEIQFRLSLT